LSHSDDAVGHDLDFLAPERRVSGEEEVRGCGEVEVAEFAAVTSGPKVTEGQGRSDIPLSGQLGIGEGNFDDSGTIDGRIRIHRSNNNQQLAQHSLSLLGGGGDHVKSSDTLSVETEVLGEGLGGHNGNTILDKVAQRESVLFGISAGESLVGNVEEYEVVLFLADLSQL
jgi:hypothetical protein